MQEITLEGKKYTIYATGETVVVYMDTFKGDLFEAVSNYYDDVSKGILKMSEISKILYAMIKTANPESVDSYRSFMQSIKHPGSLVRSEITTPLLMEVNEMMDIGNLVKDEAVAKKKRKKKRSRPQNLSSDVLTSA
ncbi:MAG: hypothetical protein IKE94_15535 [Aeriscardovia sp.]|nr:hypothetical protein [Aeriscardovia sp.]